MLHIYVEHDTCFDDLYLFNKLSPFTNKTKANNKWDYIKLKWFCMVTDAMVEIKRHLTECDKIFAYSTPDQCLVSKMDKTKRSIRPIILSKHAKKQ